MKDETKIKKLQDLFLTTFVISASTSGGYAIISMIKDRFVNKKKWIEEEEMIDLISIAQSTPGPLAINAGILVGYKVAGITGALTAMFAMFLPPLIIMSIVANCYNLIASNQAVRYVMKGMSAAVAAVLVSVTVDLFINLTKEHSILSYILAIISFVIAKFTDISYLYIALLCATCGIIKVMLMKRAGN